MITVVVADDQELVRTGLCLILQAQDDIEVVADVADGRAALDAVRLHHPDVALLVVRMPVTTGLEAARAILEGPGPTRVVMLTTFDDDSYLYDALSAGASGFLLKSSPAPTCCTWSAPRWRGRRCWTPPSPADWSRCTCAAPADSMRVRCPLSSRRSVRASSRCSASWPRGASNTRIAGNLLLAETTVKTHVAAVLRKLGLRDRTQAVVLGYESGLVVPGDAEDEGTMPEAR